MGVYNYESDDASSPGSVSDAASAASSSDLSSCWSSDLDSVTASCGAVAGGDRRERRFHRLLRGRRRGRGRAGRGRSTLSKKELRSLCWSGVPDRYRAESWRLLLDYVPADRSRRGNALRRKRAEYAAAAERCYGEPIASYSPREPLDDDSQALSEMAPEIDAGVLRQVRKDVPRTVPDLALFRDARIQARLERVLYVWAHRNPAAGYVQGMNDVAVPFFIAFLKGAYHHWDVDGRCDIDSDSDSDDDQNFDRADDFGSNDESQPPRALEDIPDSVLDGVEADVYWCLTRLLSGMQDHYTHGQPGILRMIGHLEDVLAAIDPSLSDHLRSTGVQVLHFAFRWMNCLLVRELPLNCVLRLFDSYLSEEDAAQRDELQVYVCASLLVRYSSRLRSMDHDALFESLTQSSGGGGGGGEPSVAEEITATHLEEMLGQAHIWRTSFGGSQARIECAKMEEKRRRQAAAAMPRRPSAPCSLEKGQDEKETSETAAAADNDFVDRASSALSGVGVGMSDADFLCY